MRQQNKPYLVMMSHRSSRLEVVYGKFCALETFLAFMEEADAKDWVKVQNALETLDDATPCKSFAYKEPGMSEWAALFRHQDASFPRSFVFAAKCVDRIEPGAISYEDTSNALRAACASNSGQFVRAIWKHCVHYAREKEFVERVVAELARAPVPEEQPNECAIPALYGLSEYFSGLLRAGSVYFTLPSAVAWYQRTVKAQTFDVVASSLHTLLFAFKENNVALVLAVQRTLPDAKYRWQGADMDRVNPEWVEYVYSDRPDAFIEHLQYAGPYSPVFAAFDWDVDFYDASAAFFPEFWKRTASFFVAASEHMFHQTFVFNPWLLQESFENGPYSVAGPGDEPVSVLNWYLNKATENEARYPSFKREMVKVLGHYTKDPRNVYLLVPRTVEQAALICDLLEAVPENLVNKDFVTACYSVIAYDLCGEHHWEGWAQKSDAYERFFREHIFDIPTALERFHERMAEHHWNESARKSDAYEHFFRERLFNIPTALEKFHERLLKGAQNNSPISLESALFLKDHMTSVAWARKGTLRVAWKKKLLFSPVKVAEQFLRATPGPQFLPEANLVVNALKKHPSKWSRNVSVVSIIKLVCNSWSRCGFLSVLDADDKEEVVRHWFKEALREKRPSEDTTALLRFMLHDLKWSISHATYLDVLVAADLKRKRLFIE